MHEWQQMPERIIRVLSSRCLSLSDPSPSIQRQTSHNRHRSRPLSLCLTVQQIGSERRQHRLSRSQSSCLDTNPPPKWQNSRKLYPARSGKSLFLPTENDPAADRKVIFAQIEAYIDSGADALLFDTADFSSGQARFGGTGKRSDWNLSAQLIQTCKVPAFLSGGIRPENVRAAIETARPYGVDLCSGVEASKGVRDQRKLDRLMKHARSGCL